MIWKVHWLKLKKFAFSEGLSSNPTAMFDLMDNVEPYVPWITLFCYGQVNFMKIEYDIVCSSAVV